MMQIWTFGLESFEFFNSETWQPQNPPGCALYKAASSFGGGGFDQYVKAQNPCFFLENEASLKALLLN